MRRLQRLLLAFSFTSIVHSQTETVEWGLKAPVLTIPGVFTIEKENNGFDSNGFQLSEALKCAVNEINSAGILPGLPVVADIRDSGGRVADATTAGRDFVSDSYLYPFVVDSSGKQTSIALNLAVKDSGVSVLTYYEPGTKLDTAPSSNMIRIYPTDAYQARALVGLIKSLPNLANLGVAQMSSSDPNGIYSSFDALATKQSVLRTCVFPSATVPTLTEFSTCLKNSNVKYVIVFGEPEDVLAKLPSVTFAADTILLGPSTWANDANLAILSRSISSSVLVSTYTVRPISGKWGTFANCLNKLNSTSRTSVAYQNFWQSTFSCSLTQGDTCPGNVGSNTTVCRCHRNMKLNQVLTYNRGANYIMDGVITVVNALANLMYNCQGLSSYLPAGYNVTQLCARNFVNGTVLNDIIRALPFVGLSGPVSYSGTERIASSFDLLQYDGTRFVSSGNWTTATTMNGTPDTEALGNILALARLTQGKAGIVTTNQFIQIDWSTGASIAVAVLSGLGIIAALGFAGFVYVKREHPVIKRASPLFCCLMLSGIVLIYIDLFLWSGVQNRALCISKIWIPIIGFSVLMGPMLAKTFRIWKIFDNSKLRTRRILTTHLLGMSAIVVGLNLVFLIIWTAVDPLYPMNVEGRYGTCKGNIDGFQTAFIIIFAAYNGILLILGSCLSFLTRNVSNAFNESKFIGYTMYNFSVVMCVVLPIYYSVNVGNDSSVNIRTFVIRSAGTLFANTACLLILFAPKVYHVIMDTPDTGDEVVKKGTTAKNTSQGTKVATTGSKGVTSNTTAKAATSTAAGASSNALQSTSDGTQAVESTVTQKTAN